MDEAPGVVNDAQVSLGLSTHDLIPAVQDDDSGLVFGALAASTPAVLDTVAPTEEVDAVAELDLSLEASTPMEVVTEDSAVAPLDSLGLVSTAEERSPVDVADDGTTTMETDQGLRVVQAHGDGALRVHHIIHSSDADHQFSFDILLSDTIRAVPTADGGLDFVETVQDSGATSDLLVGRLDAPWAVDANGDSIPTRYQIDDHRVVQVVERTPSAAYPIVADPFWIPAVVIALRVGTVALKIGSRTVRYTKAPASRVINSLKNYTSLNFRAGSHTFKLDKSGMKHILERHHPKYWNGTTKKDQTFFNANMSINDVRSLIHAAMKQKAPTLRTKGTNGTIRVSGTVNGVKYTMTIVNGRVVQFYPR